ncbi:MAG TPA: hypothetical protein VND87_12145 [Stellaceae bacterium]|nr:hypothetical protein [Stellaceae bacterium]
MKFLLQAPPHLRGAGIQLPDGRGTVHVPPNGIVEATAVEVTPDNMPGPVLVRNVRDVEQLLNMGFKHIAGAFDPESGPRPAGCYIGEMLFDAALGRPLWWTTEGWRDATGNLAEDI